MPCNDATLPASVVMSYLGVAAIAGERVNATSAPMATRPSPVRSMGRSNVIPRVLHCSRDVSRGRAAAIAEGRAPR